MIELLQYILTFIAILFFLFYSLLSPSQPLWCKLKQLLIEWDDRIVFREPKNVQFKPNQNCVSMTSASIIFLSCLYYSLCGSFNPETDWFYPYPLFITFCFLLFYNLIDLVKHVIPSRNGTLFCHHLIVLVLTYVSFIMPFSSIFFPTIYKMPLVELSSVCFNFIQLVFETVDKEIISRTYLIKVLKKCYYVYMAQRFIFVFYGLYTLSFIQTEHYSFDLIEKVYIGFIVLLTFFHFLAMIHVYNWFHRKMQYKKRE